MFHGWTISRKMALTSQLMYIILWIGVVQTQITKGDFGETLGFKKGKRLDHESLGTNIKSSKSECVLMCHQTPGCESVNVRFVNNMVECEAQSEVTLNPDYFIPDDDSLYIYSMDSVCQNDLFTEPSTDSKCSKFFNAGSGGQWVKEKPQNHNIYVWDNYLYTRPDPYAYCAKQCNVIPSCIFYYISAIDCMICVDENDVDDNEHTYDGGSATPANVMLKRNIEEKFYTTTGSACTLSLITSQVGNYFSYTVREGRRITAIQPCASNNSDYLNILAGFDIYIDETNRITYGCSNRRHPEPFGKTELSVNEDIMKLKIYMGSRGGYDVITGMRINTNMRILPGDNQVYGDGSGDEDYAYSGYDLTGLHGMQGEVLFSLGVTFRLCD